MVLLRTKHLHAFYEVIAFNEDYVFTSGGGTHSVWDRGFKEELDRFNFGPGIYGIGAGKRNDKNFAKFKQYFKDEDLIEQMRKNIKDEKSVSYGMTYYSCNGAKGLFEK